MSTESGTEANTAPALIVFGRDGAAKPHASCFAPSEAELAEKAAGLMGMKVLRVESDEQRELAAQLPSGKVFASGRAFVPFVKAALYERLRALGEVGGADERPAAASATADPETPPVAAPEPPKAEVAKTDATMAKSGKGSSGSGGGGDLPPAWADITVGSLVLASEAPMDGWWESVVIGVKDELFTLRWRDFPGEPVFARRRWHLAILPPSTGVPARG